MSPKRGRPRKVDHGTVKSAIHKHKNEIVGAKNQIAPKSHPVWVAISKEINGDMPPSGLYSFVSCDRSNIKTELTARVENGVSIEDDRYTGNETSENLDPNISNASFSDTSASDDPCRQTEKKVVISFEKKEFQQLLSHKSYKRSEKHRSHLTQRQYTVLEPGKWQCSITEKLWEKMHLKCAFNFKNHKMNMDQKSGYVNGNCNCGATIRGKIEELNTEIILMTCKITEGNGTCGKRYLRAPDRQTIGKHLCETNKSAAVYRAEKADELMSPGDPEPPHLPKSSAIKSSKHEFMKSLYLDPDPVKALAISQLECLHNAIHNLGLNPFYVHYWTNHQLHVYRSYSNNQPACVSIDATGSIVRKIERCDKSKSKSIFLYECVVNWNGGQFPVAQMLTESHTTNSIQFWLMEWIKTGAPHPKEVVCDSSKALLTAAVRTFTPYATINEYADACRESSKPNCYIRIDVAHFIKMYGRFLKQARSSVKKFYLAAIGQLILAKDVDDAQDLVESILIISQSETEGHTDNGLETHCERHKSKLNRLLTEETPFEFDDDILDETNDDFHEEVPGDDLHRNTWHLWGKNMNEKIKITVQQEKGDRLNAHFMPKLATRLMSDLMWLPLWSCIYRDQFGYGRIPASSASVEGDFNDIKTRLLRNVPLPMRVDCFVEKHINYINGRTKIIDAATNETVSQQNAENCEPSSEEQLTQSSASLNAIDMLTLPADGEVQCPVCADGNFPTGAHKCTICSKAVHIIDGCSEPVEGEDEGYGEKRVCVSCKRMQARSLTTILDSREVENWRGLASDRRVKPVTKKNTSRYLRANYLANEFLLHEKLVKIPIIKNGHSLTLKAIKIGGKSVSLANTCAFDTVFQIFLAGMYDRPALKNALFGDSEINLFFKLIQEVSSRGINATSYRRRTEILSNLFPSIERQNGCDIVDCAATIGDLCRLLFYSTPSFEEVSTCDQGCPPRTKSLPRIQIGQSCLESLQFSKEVEENVVLPGPTECYRTATGCRGFETTVITKIASFILLETDPTNGNKIRLCDIPQFLKLSIMQDEYQLVGIAHFKPPVGRVQTRRSDSEFIGHYTAISRRKNATWVEYNDVKDKEQPLRDDYMALPSLLVYSA